MVESSVIFADNRSMLYDLFFGVPFAVVCFCCFELVFLLLLLLLKSSFLLLFTAAVDVVGVEGGGRN